MEHQVLQACQNLLRTGQTPHGSTEELTAYGYTPLSIDIDRDVAAVAVLRSGSSELLNDDRYIIEYWKFRRRRNGTWVFVGGGGGSAPGEPADPLAPRRPASQGDYLRRWGGGSTAADADSLWPWGRRRIHHAKLHVSAEVKYLQIGSRLIEVPVHGHMVAVWSSRTAPTARALGAGKEHLASLDLNSDVPGP